MSYKTHKKIDCIMLIQSKKSLNMQHNQGYYYQSRSSMDSTCDNNNQIYAWIPHYYNNNTQDYNWNPYFENIRLQDFGTMPFSLKISQATKQNNIYRTALRTDKNSQFTLISIMLEIKQVQKHILQLINLNILKTVKSLFKWRIKQIN